MKKEYINPEILVVRIQQSQMLCASIQSLDNTSVNMIDDADKKITDENDVW